MNKKVLRQISYGVYLVSAMDGDRLTGCIVNCVMQVTSTPPTVAVSINRDNYTHGCIEKSGQFAVSVLDVNTDPKLIARMGFASGRTMDKFDGVDYEMKDGLPIVKEACGYFVLKLMHQFECGTHTLFWGEMVSGDVIADRQPMTYQYYQQVIKGKSAKNAPTYQGEEKESGMPMRKTKKPPIAARFAAMFMTGKCLLSSCRTATAVRFAGRKSQNLKK